MTPGGGGSVTTNTFAAGATLGPGSGSINIAGPVSVAGDLNDGSMPMNVMPGGTLGGGGSLDEWATLNWTGGTLSLGGGVFVYGSLNSSGGGALTLGTTLTNEETTTLAGAGPLGLTPGGSIVNLFGDLTLSQSLSVSGGPGSAGLSNAAGANLIIPAGLSTPVTISVPFTNDGNLKVEGGSALNLTSPPTGSGTPTIDLDGTLGLDGNLYLLNTATSSTGFTLSPQSGFFEVGTPPGVTPSGFGSLIVPTGVTDTINGNLEITNSSTLSGGGTISNGGRLQLDAGSGTPGLGNYTQLNSGTLAESVLSSGSSYILPSPLTVTGTAQLSGILVLLGYNPPVVGTTFTVVTAGNVVAHFDTVPNGMSQTETPTTASVTQVS